MFTPSCGCQPFEAVHSNIELLRAEGNATRQPRGAVRPAKCTVAVAAACNIMALHKAEPLSCSPQKQQHVSQQT